jgi:hypothetical protein
MALNSDFKVKDSLYVGNSACFVTMTDTPMILSAGTSLFDIFLQEGEISASCALTNGDGIATLSYDGSADTTITLDSAVVDGIAEGSAQGQIGVTNIGNTTTQVDVNGLQTGDTPTFGGLALNGALTTSSTVDGVDIATRDAQLSVLQGLSANNVTSGSSPSQGTVTLTKADSSTVTIDTGLQAGDSPSFTGLTITSVPTGTSNTVLVSDGGVVTSDFIDSRVWGTSLVDGSGTAQKLTMWSDANTVTDSIITQNGSNDAINIAGGLSATALSGDGSCLTNVVATDVTFPTTAKTDLDEEDRFFIRDDTDGSNKYVTYNNLLVDAAGTNMGLEVNGSDSLALKNYSNLSNSKVSKWDSTNGQFVDSIMTETAAGCINIAGGLTITDNLSVMGTFTCIDTSVSTTSALSVINTGTGPALYTEQTGVSQPIAQFVDTEGGQIVFGDTGNVGIGIAGLVPSEKLTVSGNISANGTLVINGDTTLGDASGDDLTICGAVINAPNIASGTQDGNQVLVRNGDDEIVLDGVDSKIFADSLVDSSSTTTTNNQIPKFSNTTGTIGNSNISDNGSLVTIETDVMLDEGASLQIFATGGVKTSNEQTFTATVGTGGTVVTTFAKSGLNSVKYNVALVNGVNKTAFEILVVYNGTTSVGTVYGIVDAQAASQLDDIEVSNSGSTIDLTITSASASTTAIIQGKALY